MEFVMLAWVSGGWRLLDSFKSDGHGGVSYHARGLGWVHGWQLTDPQMALKGSHDDTYLLIGSIDIDGLCREYNPVVLAK